MYLPQTRCRTARRRPLQTEILMQIGDTAIPIEAIDISESGVFLAMDVLPEEGDTFDLLFNLPDGGTPVRARGEVARVQSDPRSVDAGRHQRPGIGLQFVDLADRARARLDQYSASPIV